MKNFSLIALIFCSLINPLSAQQSEAPEIVTEDAAAIDDDSLDASIEVGQPIYLNTIWNLRSEGIAVGGATSRIRATADRCHAFNN